MNLFKRITLLISLGIGLTAFGETVQDRMKERLPVIQELKAKGVVGEDKNGYLQFVTAAKEQETAVANENADRKTIYTEIASKTPGVSAEQVGQRRAAKIYEQAASGDWIQDANGKWIKKP